MKIRDIIRKLTPDIILSRYRASKKKQVRANLNKQKEKGNILDVKSVEEDLKSLGIKNGDTVLIHASMSKIGYLKEGPKTFVDAVLNAIGPTGNILMPSSPNAALQLDYVRKNKVFDVRYAPSRMGAISEYFRKMPGVLRSLSPTEPVCAYGPKATYLTEGHFGETTPYTEKSPFRRLYDLGGKILYIGVTLDNAGTNLHTLEDAVNFPYPVYFDEVFDMSIVDSSGHASSVAIKVHNPEWSAKRKCDHLIPMFETQNVCRSGRIGSADVLVFDGNHMFETMLNAFHDKGVTMYHPNGIKEKS